MITARTARTLVGFALVVAAFAALAAILTSGTEAHAVQAAPVVAVEAPAPVEPAELPDGAHTADEAFLADLFGPDVDVSPEAALYLTETGRRYCTFVVEGQTVPGAEVQTREGYVESLTMPGDPHALTMDEATKLLDVAEGAYCPPTR